MTGAAGIDAWIVALVARLSPAARNKVLRDVAVAIRRANSERMGREVGPDGDPWEPRKPQRDRAGKVRRAAKMMRGLRRVRRMPIRTQGGEATLAFTGRARRIAAVHHFGGVDQVTEGVKADYPARPLLGIAPEDLPLVRDILLRHLSPEG